MARIWTTHRQRYESIHLSLRRLRWLFERQSSQNYRKFAAALNEVRFSDPRLQLDRLGHFVQPGRQSRRSLTVANAKTIVFYVNVPVEKRPRLLVHLDNSSLPVKNDRWYAHPIKGIHDECARSTPAP